LNPEVLLAANETLSRDIPMERLMPCRFCSTELRHIFIDLGLSPLSNAYIKPENLSQGEIFYPLRAWVCHNCFLVQAEEFSSPSNIFSDYAYFSSFSESWLAHARNYAKMISDKCALNENSLVVEIASNDGYLLQYFVELGIPVLGLEPAANVAEVATKKGVRTEVAFFGEAMARQLHEKYGYADLMVGNNVLGHVPDINNFIKGFKTLLHPNGLLTMEFPSLHNLLRFNQFDTIYHEHFSYLSLSTVHRIFQQHGLAVYDVQKLPTHGGSLRIYVQHQEKNTPETQALRDVLQEEEEDGLCRLDAYSSFAQRVLRVKADLLEFLLQAQRAGKQVVAYGAAAKGNTLLNYAGVKSDLISYVVDLNPYKRGRYLPGSRIPIRDPKYIFETKPDYVLILPWNLQDEISRQMASVRKWGGQFVVPIPQLTILP
jgi:cyclopropane fatty-acyl-phospholipid synthase-like methyltransferase